MDIIEELFARAKAVSTPAVAAAFRMSESNARTWADELEVAKIGASFVWVRSDVEALVEQLDKDDGTEDDADETDEIDEIDETETETLQCAACDAGVDDDSCPDCGADLSDDDDGGEDDADE